MDQNSVITREQQKTEDTWNMQDLYATEELFQEYAEKLSSMMEAFSSMKCTLGKGEQELQKALQLYEQMNEVFESLYVYAFQKYHEDTTNPKYQQMSGEMQIIAANLSQAVSWMEPELLSLPENAFEREKLAKYKRFILQIVRQKAHVLDDEKEALLARAGELGQSPSNIFSMFNNADIRFPEVEDTEGTKRVLTVGNYISFMQSKDRVLRRNAFEALYSVYGQFINTLAATFYANLKQADFFAKEHRYQNAMECSLDTGNIPVAVYKNLVQAVNDRLPLMHRYVRLRKKLLGLEELHMYDVYAPMVEVPDQTYSFEEAKQIVKAALAPLGEDYQKVLQQGFDNRWIDVYENRGKRTGAYSWTAYGTHPYVLLNYHGTLDDVFTLAHEMGHALHSWYSNENQPYLYAGYLIFVAEVASTCNEALLIHDLLERSKDKKERMYLINHFLEQFKGTMYRQTMFAEFEMITHGVVEQGGMLTAEQINGIYLNLNKKYFGEDMVSDGQIAYEWARIPHFYTPFYVYQYATGFAAAIAISSKILAGEPGIVEKYKKFLSGGCSMDPIDLLKICGVDMSSPEPIQEALDVFERYLEEMEREL